MNPTHFTPEGHHSHSHFSSQQSLPILSPYSMTPLPPLHQVPSIPLVGFHLVQVEHGGFPWTIYQKFLPLSYYLSPLPPCISLTGMCNPLSSPSFYLFLFASRIYGLWRQRTYIPSSIILVGLNFILRNSSMTGT